MSNKALSYKDLNKKQGLCFVFVSLLALAYQAPLLVTDRPTPQYLQLIDRLAVFCDGVDSVGSSGATRESS